MEAAASPPFIELPSPFAVDCGVVKMIEPGDADRRALLEQVIHGVYDKPFVIDDGYARTLYFSLHYAQSAMRLKRPFDLELLYTRKMMSFLLFMEQPPANILMLGLGGGSLAKYCYRRLPAAQIRVVEVNPHVLAFREQFRIPADDERFRVILGDAAAYVADCPERPAVIMMDAFDRHGFPDSVSSRNFYADVHRALAADGLMVANLAGEDEPRQAHLAMIRTVFGANTLVLPVSNDGNHIVFAFRNPDFAPCWSTIERRAVALGKEGNVDFVKYAQKLARAQARPGRRLA
ncbi:MAG TPA: fused MFS/spermidine synthase [Azonexus sp.]|nr:fused MFS/spermidine synthase [Azonexus sp.]